MTPLAPENVTRPPTSLEKFEETVGTASPGGPSRDFTGGTDDLLQAYIRDQNSTSSVLSPSEEQALFKKLERQVRFTHNFRLKHPITLLYLERLYNKIVSMPTEEAADYLSLFVRTPDSKHVPEQLHGARLATFLEHASDHRVVLQQAIDCIQALKEARRNNSPVLPEIKADYLAVLARSAESIRELVLVPGHFVAISDLIKSHCEEIKNNRNTWADTDLARLDSHLGFTLRELEQRQKTLQKAEVELEDLRKTAIESNLRLVVTIALRYRNKGLELLDLIQEGNLGLMKAVDRFDHRLGNRFSTYAGHWIQQAIKKALLDKARPIRLPEGKAELLVTLSRTTAQLTQKLNRTPSVEELAREVGMAPQVISHLLNVAASPVSLQRTYASENNEKIDLRDMIADADAVFPWEMVDRRYLKDVLPDLLKALSDEDRRIIELRHGIGTEDGKPMTLVEVARLVYKGVTVVHRRQIESIRKRQARALKKLQHPARIKQLM